MMGIKALEYLFKCYNTDFGPITLQHNTFFITNTLYDIYFEYIKRHWVLCLHWVLSTLSHTQYQAVHEMALKQLRHKHSVGRSSRWHFKVFLGGISSPNLWDIWWFQVYIAYTPLSICVFQLSHYSTIVLKRRGRASSHGVPHYRVRRSELWYDGPSWGMSLIQEEGPIYGDYMRHHEKLHQKPCWDHGVSGGLICFAQRCNKLTTIWIIWTFNNFPQFQPTMRDVPLGRLPEPNKILWNIDPLKQRGHYEVSIQFYNWKIYNKR